MKSNLLLLLLAIIALTGCRATPTPARPANTATPSLRAPTVTPIPPPSRTPTPTPMLDQLLIHATPPLTVHSTVAVQQNRPPAPTPPPTATPQSSATGRLVFMTANGGSLYLINADGSDLRHLADGIIDPVVSPDGRQVAFTRWDGAELGQVYTLSLDDGSEHPIFPDAIRQPKSPAWSPNGRQMIISFQSGGLRDPEEICHEYDADDGFHPPENIAKVTKSRFSDGVWVFCYLPMEDLRWRLRWINIETGSFEDLPAADYSFTPAWDPYLPWRIIYDSTKGLMQFDVTTGQQWAITTDLRDKVPVFSPDGQKLALTYKQHDHWEVYTLDLATGERHRLTKPPILADPQYNSAAPAWSPDGRQIAFVTDRTGVWELWVMNSDGSDQHPLFPAETQAQFSLRYDGVNERMLNWIDGE